MKGKLRLRLLIAALAVVAANTPVVYAAAKDAMRQARLHSVEYESRMGRWDVLRTMAPLRSVHAALLHDGRVLLAAGSGNNRAAFEAGTFSTAVWNPQTGRFADVPTPWDMFCAGHSFLPDGRLLVAGGTKAYESQDGKLPFKGLRDSYLFDPATSTYTRVQDLNAARWYPTLVSLGSGNVVAGLDEHGKQVKGITEVFHPGDRTWNLRTDLEQWFPTYPNMILMADGRLFYSGVGSGYGTVTDHPPGIWNLATNGYQPVPGLPDPLHRDEGATVLLPPAQRQKVLVLGGGKPGGDLHEPATATTAVVDLRKKFPAFQRGPDLSARKRYVSAVILPDRTVLQTGGSALYRNAGADVLDAQRYNPWTNKLTEVASPTVGRNYHSEALLLPDGRVATFGGNPLDNSFEQRIEVYSPPYLYRASGRRSRPRPRRSATARR